MEQFQDLRYGMHERAEGFREVSVEIQVQFLDGAARPRG